MAQMKGYVFDREEDIVSKQENACYLHILLLRLLSKTSPSRP